MIAEQATVEIINGGQGLPIIFIVDNDDDTRKLFKEAAKLPKEVGAYLPAEQVLMSDPTTAIRLLDKAADGDRPVAVIMDVGLPGIDGITALRTIRKNERDLNQRPVKVALYTGLADDEALPGYRIELDIEQVYKKPCGVFELVKGITEWLGLEQKGQR